MPVRPLPIAIAHLDESCLGNGREGENPGGAGGLIEIRHLKTIERREFFIHAPATTNNRMALAGAIALLQLLAGKGKRRRGQARCSRRPTGADLHGGPDRFLFARIAPAHELHRLRS